MSDEPVMTNARVFQLEEYRALRKEIEFYIAEFRSQERSVVIADGVIWGWLISHGMWNYLAWSMPVILTAAAAIRSHLLSQHMRVISNYIEHLERSFGVDGWEQMFTAKVRNVKRGQFSNALLTYALLTLAIVGFLFHNQLLK
jgi:hypothetical protein